MTFSYADPIKIKLRVIKFYEVPRSKNLHFENVAIKTSNYSKNSKSFKLVPFKRTYATNRLDKFGDWNI